MANSETNRTSKLIAAADSPLHYRRIRVPKNHGHVLHLPGPDTWDEIWRSNCAIDLTNANFQTGSLAGLKNTTRSEVIAAALNYTRQYRDVDMDDRSHDRIVMGGHQPGLFHPGVWYKNFVLSDLGKQFQAIAINLVVDNDNCSTSYINVPIQGKVEGEYRFHRIRYDEDASSAPYEVRNVANYDRFQNFGATVKKHISDLVRDPIVDKLWPMVMKNSGEGNLGHSLARGRHRLEQDFDAQTIELPISLVAKTKSFAGFAKEVLTRHQELSSAYNDSILVYRQIHKIKNTAQPLPLLRRSSDWTETPFWIWTQELPQRRSLYVKSSGSTIELSDLNSVCLQFTEQSSIEEIGELLNVGQSIRPKALMTTLFHRLFACDMFIHGIGGSKYDQLTDAIAEQLFGIALPKYITISGTYKISENDSQADLDASGIKHQLRSLMYHPENHIENPGPEAKNWIDQKQQWIKKQLPQGHRLPRHNAIEQSNAKLQPFVEDLEKSMRTRLADAIQRHSNAKVIDSRELSFCIHSLSLIESLQKTW